MHAHSISYRKQYEYNSILLILTNLFGPGDNFNPDTSHVIAALIKRFYDAKKIMKKKLLFGVMVNQPEIFVMSKILLKE